MDSKRVLNTITHIQNEMELVCENPDAKVRAKFNRVQKDLEQLNFSIEELNHSIDEWEGMKK